MMMMTSDETRSAGSAEGNGTYMNEQEKQKEDTDHAQNGMDESSAWYSSPSSSHTPRPMCSVLNIVIDYTMEDVTPFEPEEWKEYKRHQRRERMQQKQKQKADDTHIATKIGGNQPISPFDGIFKDGDGFSSGTASPSTPATARVRVPVMRIFGPVMRGPASFPPPSNQQMSSSTVKDDEEETNTTANPAQPIQSACLHIHGAFPYLLARPVVAGPDGSIFHHTDDNNFHQGGCRGRRRRRPLGRVDWDSRAEVEKLTNNIHAVLEESIQGLFDNSNNPKNGGGNNATSINSSSQRQQHQQPKYRVIRKISVVEGRGFYGYCPGPPAPFLKIEYYDPKLRWKVKLVLEKGLSSLPARYHPDPRQYKHYDSKESNVDSGGRGQHGRVNVTSNWETAQRIEGGKTVIGSNKNNDNDEEDDDDDMDLDELDVCDLPLKFRCYEAHIPYTMQFFKDYNLAGMSYIHISYGKIRGALPSSYLSTVKNKVIQLKTENFKAAEDENTDMKMERFIFLSSNTPKQFLWQIPMAKQDGVAFVATTTDNHSSTIPGAALSTPKNSPKRYNTSIENNDRVADDKSLIVGKFSPGRVPATPLRQPSQETDDDYATSVGGGENRGLKGKTDSSFSENGKNLVQDFHLSKAKQISFEKFGSDEKVIGGDDDDTFNPPSRISSCDIELDCSVDDILNILAVMTTMPSDQEQRDQVHWRAVPSLQEWWRQEEQRLKKYLAPSLTADIMSMSQKRKFPTLPEEKVSPGKVEEDGRSTGPESKLDTKRDNSPRSGTRLAVKGMWSLVNVSEGLREEFVRALSDILIRHAQAVLEADKGYRRQGVQKAMPYSTTNELTKNGYRNHFTPTSVNHGDTKGAKTPTTHEAIDALEALMNSVTSESPDLVPHASRCSPALENEMDDDELSPRMNDDINEENVLKALETLSEEDGERSVSFSLKNTAEKKSDNSTPTRQLFTQTHCCDVDPSINGISLLDEFQFSQRVDRGESILGNLDDIDPQTLRPRDELEDEEEDASAIELFLTQSQENFSQPDTDSRIVQQCGSFTENTPRRVRFADQVQETTTNQKSFEVPAIGRNFEAVDPNVKDNEDDSGDENEEPEQSEENVTDLKDITFPNGEGCTMDGSICDGKSYETDVQCTNHRFNGLAMFGAYAMPSTLAPNRKRVSSWSCRGRRNESQQKMRKGSNERLEIDSNSRQFIAVGKESGHSADHDHVEEVKWEPSQKLSMTQSQVSQDEGIGRIPDERTHTAGPWPETQQESADPLDGIGAQGGRIHVHGGGALKAKTRSTQPSAAVLEGTDAMGRSNFFSTPVTIMSVEIHVQCREGESRLGSRKKIPMTPDSNKDKISAIVFVFARDPGGGEDLKVLSRGCILTTLEGENPRKESSINMKMQQQLQRSVSRSSFGVVCPFKIEVVKDERQILLRFKDIIRKTDPDILLSWDMQGAGVGYIIERGVALGRSSSQVDSSIGGATVSTSIDMVKLLGRTPTDKRFSHCIESNLVEKMNVNSEHGGGEPDDAKAKDWVGSGLGSDWDDKVGPGAAAASIIGRLAFSAWKTISEEVKHGNASYQPAIVAAVLGRRIPHFNDLTLTKWFASKTERRKVLDHRLDQATASLLLFTDALDIIGRAGEAARLSGVTFAESFPGVRGSQYKVEGVLLRALQSLRSDERGDKNGRRSRSGASSQHSLVSSGASSTGNSKSQTQSPWKLRRQSNYFGNCDEEGVPVQEDRQYFFFSPSLEDTNQQEALEVQALTLEPKSGYYTDPVIVCDFTALYPSLIIAYNLCYSTCAGRLEYHSTRGEMRKGGKTRERVGPFHYPEEKTATILQHHMKSLSSQRVGEHDSSLDDCIFYNDRAYISPTGAIYLSESVVKGVLPQVLDEMLTTRAMLKRAMKELKKSTRPVPSAVFRQLEARQLALKYVANVTYGYTSATFSGRCAMPTLADTIVELARRTLRNAIDVANRWGQGTDPWGKKDHRWLGARVIYGDTDSLFVRLPKKSHKVAFEFGELLCAAVTSLNPPPVQLKLEKVYRGCIMQTMKRYGGMKYESKDQKKPIFEAKGLETVRRDQCRLTQEILKNSLIMLFRHGIQEVREYLERQWSMILRDELPVSYFILTGRVRSQYRGGREGPVQAVLSRRLAEADPGLIVRHGQRVPYVIAAIPGKNFTLKDCVLTPMEMLEGWDAYKINARYYIVKLVNAALNRCLKLAPHYVDVNDWYQSCPKPRRRVHIWPVKSNASMITSFFGFDICSLCQQKCYADGSKQVVVCDYCRRDPAKSILLASTRLSQVEQAAHRVAKECSKCNGCFESSDTYAVVQNIAKDNTSSNSGDHQQQHHYHQRVLVRTKDRRKVEQTMLLPLANCNCIDCPNTFRRHRLREQGIEASDVFDLLTSY